jgi:cell division protein FtsL
MKKIALISILIVEALFIVILGLQILAKAKENLSLRLEIKQVAQDLQTKETQAKELGTQLEESNKVRGELESKVKGLTETQKVMEAKMDGMKQATDTLAKQFDTQQRDMFRELADLTEKNKETIVAFLDKIRSIIHMKMSLERISAPSTYESIRSPARDVPLGKIVVSASAKRSREKYEKRVEAPLGPESIGKVLNVDSKYGLVIVDLGKEAGVKPGMRYTVLRDQRKVGQIVLREIYKGMSVAETVSDKTGLAIQQGDRLANAE